MTLKVKGGRVFPNNEGMSLRDYFAGQALIRCSSIDDILNDGHSPQEWYDDVSDAAYKLADAMIKQREII